jgi:hypothetical protein
MIWYVVDEHHEHFADSLDFVHEDKIAQYRPDFDCTHIAVYSLHPDGTYRKEEEMEKLLLGRIGLRKDECVTNLGNCIGEAAEKRYSRIYQKYPQRS